MFASQLAATAATTARRLAAAAAIALAALAATSTPARAETVQIPVPQPIVLGAFNTVLASLSVHLDAYGPKHTSGRYLSWFEENASSVTLAGVGAKTFSLAEIDKKTTKTRRLRAYVNDIDTIAATASMHGGDVRLTALFESGGYEVKIKCLRYRVLKKDWKDECVIPSIAGKGLDVDDGVLTADLTPIAYDGSISLQVAATSFGADVQAHGLCNALDGLCDRITDYKAKVRKSVRDLTFQLLDRKDLRQLVAAKVRKALEDAHVLEPDWEVTAVTASGGNFLITVDRPDQIDGGSVSILSFAPKTASLSYGCPLNVGFDATIRSKYALSGRAWLENENGTTTPKLDWTAAKGQVASSTIARAFGGVAGRTYANRWSRLVVEWKDQQGTLYTAKSQKGFFSVTCSKAVGGFAG